MVTVELNVTKSKIAKGHRRNNSSCPIALAAIAAGFKNVSVDSESIEFTDKNGEWYAISTPPTATKFIERFDIIGAEAVKPFKFRVRIKNSVAKLLKLKKRYIVAA